MNTNETVLVVKVEEEAPVCAIMSRAALMLIKAFALTHDRDQAETVACILHVSNLELRPIHCNPRSRDGATAHFTRDEIELLKASIRIRESSPNRQNPTQAARIERQQPRC
jgi:hypothetical protein